MKINGQFRPAKTDRSKVVKVCVKKMKNIVKSALATLAQDIHRGANLWSAVDKIERRFGLGGYVESLLLAFAKQEQLARQNFLKIQISKNPEIGLFIGR